MKPSFQELSKQVMEGHLPHTLFVRHWRNEVLRKSWVDFLKYMAARLGGFEWYCTFTFRESIHPESADKAYRIWISLLNRAALGENNAQWQWRLFGVRALEWQKRGVLHYHSLIGGGVDDLHRVQWCKYWEELDRKRHGMARIYKFKVNGGAESYCSKYVTKGGNIDIDVTSWQKMLLLDPTLERSPQLK